MGPPGELQVNAHNYALLEGQQADAPPRRAPGKRSQLSTPSGTTGRSAHQASSRHINAHNYPPPEAQQADNLALVELLINAHNSLKHQVYQAEQRASAELQGSVKAHNFLSTVRIILYNDSLFVLRGSCIL